jgi:hypothetical protein
LTQTEALALTLIIEGMSALVIGRALSLSAANCALAAMLASLFTHPLLWAVFYDVHAIVGPLTTPLLEAAVFLAEAPFYRWLVGCRWIDALLASLLVNAASWGAGEIIYALA